MVGEVKKRKKGRKDGKKVERESKGTKIRGMVRKKGNGDANMK